MIFLSVQSGIAKMIFLNVQSVIVKMILLNFTGYYYNKNNIFEVKMLKFLSVQGVTI